MNQVVFFVVLVSILDFAYCAHLSNGGQNAVESEDDRSKRSLIYKDTKWCGPGNISMGYDDLGANRALDSCCRDHDYCPISIPAMATKFGLRNTNLYTLSHCECDQKFMNCLRKVDAFDSNFVGMMYFNIANTQCFNFVNRSMCQPGKVVQNPILGMIRCRDAWQKYTLVAELSTLGSFFEQ